MFRIIAILLTIPTLVGTGFIASETLRNEPEVVANPTIALTGATTDVATDTATVAVTTSYGPDLVITKNPEKPDQTVDPIRNDRVSIQDNAEVVPPTKALFVSPGPVSITEASNAAAVEPTSPSVDLENLNREEEEKALAAANAQKEAEAAEKEYKKKIADVFKSLEERMNRFNREFKILLDTYENALKPGQRTTLTVANRKKDAAYQELVLQVRELNSNVSRAKAQYEAMLTNIEGHPVVLPFGGYPLPAAPFDTYTECFESITGDLTCYGDL